MLLQGLPGRSVVRIYYYYYYSTTTTISIADFHGNPFSAVDHDHNEETNINTIQWPISIRSRASM